MNINPTRVAVATIIGACAVIPATAALTVAHTTSSSTRIIVIDPAGRGVTPPPVVTRPTLGA